MCSSALPCLMNQRDAQLYLASWTQGILGYQKCIFFTLKIPSKIYYGPFSNSLEFCGDPVGTTLTRLENTILNDWESKKPHLRSKLTLFKKLRKHTSWLIFSTIKSFSMYDPVTQGVSKIWHLKVVSFTVFTRIQ